MLEALPDRVSNRQPMKQSDSCRSGSGQRPKQLGRAATGHHAAGLAPLVAVVAVVAPHVIASLAADVA